jgi:hypothetical protein
MLFRIPHIGIDRTVKKSVSISNIPFLTLSIYESFDFVTVFFFLKARKSANFKGEYAIRREMANERSSRLQGFI